MTCKYAAHIFVVERELVNIVSNCANASLGSSQAPSIISTFFLAINLIYGLFFCAVEPSFGFGWGGLAFSRGV